MDDKLFISLVKQIEGAHKRTGVWVVAFSDMAGKVHIGRVLTLWTPSGRSYVVGWVGPHMTRIGGKSNGGGFDQILQGQTIELYGGETMTLGHNWVADLEKAGFTVQRVA